MSGFAKYTLSVIVLIVLFFNMNSFARSSDPSIPSIRFPTDEEEILNSYNNISPETIRYILQNDPMLKSNALRYITINNKKEHLDDVYAYFFKLKKRPLQHCGYYMCIECILTLKDNMKDEELNNYIKELKNNIYNCKTQKIISTTIEALICAHNKYKLDIFNELFYAATHEYIDGNSAAYAIYEYYPGRMSEEEEENLFRYWAEKDKRTFCELNSRKQQAERKEKEEVSEATEIKN